MGQGKGFEAEGKSAFKSKRRLPKINRMSDLADRGYGYMRITNKIMQKNNLSNINTNKIYKDKLSTQMSTQKKINRPSDDPVIAIRALRLRSNVTEITQYYSKNIPDANSWIDVTEDALKTLSNVVTGMINQCNKGAAGYLKTEDRQIALEQLKALGEEVYIKK